MRQRVVTHTCTIHDRSLFLLTSFLYPLGAEYKEVSMGWGSRVVQPTGVFLFSIECINSIADYRVHEYALLLSIT